MKKKRDDWKIINERQDIADYYGIGQEAYARTRPKPRKGKIGKIMLEICEAHGVKESYVQAARKVAEVIPPHELADLIERSDRLSFELGKEHVTLLSTIPDAKERKTWTNAMFENRWSVEDFRDEIKDCFGSRSKGGSAVQAPQSVKEAHWSIRRFNRRFKGLAKALSGHLASNSPAELFFRTFQLDPEAKKLLVGISIGLDALEESIAKRGYDTEIVPIEAVAAAA